MIFIDSGDLGTPSELLWHFKKHNLGSGSVCRQLGVSIFVEKGEDLKKKILAITKLLSSVKWKGTQLVYIFNIICSSFSQIMVLEQNWGSDQLCITLSTQTVLLGWRRSHSDLVRLACVRRDPYPEFWMGLKTYEWSG